MYKRILILLLVAVLFLRITGDVSAGELAPASIIEDVKKHGARHVIDQFWREDKYFTDWFQVLSNIEKGKNEWLEVAIFLKPGSDAGMSTDLDFAVARALPTNPVAVLSLVETEEHGIGKFGLNDVCTCPFIEEDPDVENRYLKAAERALLDMQVPEENKKLDVLRRKCLEQIQKLEHAL
jgi:hypothetical protein